MNSIPGLHGAPHVIARQVIARHVIAAIVLATLAACGNKGPLVHPAQPRSEAPVPAPPAATDPINALPPQDTLPPADTGPGIATPTAPSAADGNGPG